MYKTCRLFFSNTILLIQCAYSSKSFIVRHRKYTFFFNKFILCIYFWLRWVFVAACGLSLVAVSHGYSSLRCTGFSLQWLLSLRSTGSRCAGFSSCSTWAQQLWRMGLVTPRHVGSSRTRDRTCVPCIGRRILNHCTTREVPTLFLKKEKNISYHWGYFLKSFIYYRWLPTTGICQYLSPWHFLNQFYSTWIHPMKQFI